MQINDLEFPSKELIHIAIGGVCPLTHESHKGSPKITSFNVSLSESLSMQNESTSA